MGKGRRAAAALLVTAAAGGWVLRRRRDLAPPSTIAPVPWPRLPDEAGGDGLGHPAWARVEQQPEWVEPSDGECPLSHPVKVKLRSGLFHLPGMVVYGRTNADRCYRSPEEAAAAGFRRAAR